MKTAKPFALVPIFALPFALGACMGSNAAPFPTYRYQGIDLLAQIEGIVRHDADCLRMRTTSPPDQDVVLIMPEGTRFDGKTVTLPVHNGGGMIALGKPVAIQGGFDTLDAGGRYIRNPTTCSGQAFTVNRIDQSATQAGE